MEGDVSGVRISPPVVEFYDTEPNNVHQLNVTVTNISKTSKSIRFYGPKTKVNDIEWLKSKHTFLCRNFLYAFKNSWIVYSSFNSIFNYEWKTLTNQLHRVYVYQL